MASLVRELGIAMNTGKVIIGSKRTAKSCLYGKAKMVIIASNCPDRIRKDIEGYARLASIPVVEFPGTSWDLGMACGKPFMVASIAILDPGESDIMTLAGERIPEE